jgi:Stress responsive A/B Barrel Domain
MLLHLVSFKYKPDVDAATRAQHRQRLGALTGLDGVIDLKVGEDVVRSPRSYDTGLAITFPNRAALDAYQKNDRHVQVVQFAAGLCDHVVAVDFEI